MTESRTAPFTAIRESALSKVNDHTARNITHHVAIPGLKKRDGSPMVVETTYTVHEIDEDWASFIVDYQFDSDPVVYGNHPLAIGALREILPASYELPDYPADVYVARTTLRDMLQDHEISGWLIIGDKDGRTLEFVPTSTARDNHDLHHRTLTAFIREYVPFRADVWWDESHAVVRIRPQRNEVKHIVRTA